jgi:hypothetical protein
MAAHHPGPGFGSGLDNRNVNFGAYHQQEYREAFRAALATGRVQPFLFPWSFIGSFFLPLLYLSIPHTQQPWLYRMRWAVAAAVVYLNVRLVQTTSADNEAMAYATGLMGAWGIIWSLRMLIFTRPQWDTARVERRPRTQKANGFKREAEKEGPSTMVPPDESVAVSLRHNEYFWQHFPSTAPFLTRLGWTADLLTSFRGAGWNFAIPSIPHPPFPKHTASSNKPGHDEPVRLDLIPLATRAGTARSPTYASFCRSRLTHFALSYLIIDLLTATMRRDPYFVLGPDFASHPLHPKLPDSYARLPLPGLTIPLIRNGAAMVGIIAVLHLYVSVLQLMIVFVLPGLLGVRAELWQHPTLFGGLGWDMVDRGLAGFWGGSWHQTFRAGFVAPADWVLSFFFPRQLHHHHHHHHHDGQQQHHHQHGLRHHKLLRSVLQLVVAFVLSALLHAAGNYTSVTRDTAVVWTSALFFLLQGVGVLLQSGTCYLLRSWMRRLPRWARRAGNLVFVLCWLQATGWGLIDDMSRGGVWLFEPVPVSPLRMMGFGMPGENWWRWEGESYGWRWHRGRHWWESGVRL